MKVLYLLPQPKQPDRIGAYTFLDEEIQALAGAGIQAYVLSKQVPDDAWCGKVRLKAARLDSATRLDVAAFLTRRALDVPLRSLLQPTGFYRAVKLQHVAATIVREENIDLIHSHFAWPDGFGGMLTRAQTGCPLVVSLRGTDILVDPAIEYGRRSSSAYDRTIRQLLKTADRTTYFSEYMRNEAVTLGARPDRTRVIRKGVDLSHFTVSSDRLALRTQLGFGLQPMILTVAGLIRRKGIHHILDALALLRDVSDFRFVVCGEGPERANLEAQSARLGLADRVTFLGRVDRETIPTYFAACDIFVLASVMEAAGNVLFEAMAAGRPVICTDSGGPGEYIDDGETGFVVPVGDPAALANRIGRLLNDPALADRLGREGRRRSVGEFAYGRMVSDLIHVYDDVLRASSLRHRPAAAKAIAS
jgi:glycosyltransferase involved in cell wall biosynthesis